MEEKFRKIKKPGSYVSSKIQSKKQQSKEVDEKFRKIRKPGSYVFSKIQSSPAHRRTPKKLKVISSPGRKIQLSSILNFNWHNILISAKKTLSNIVSICYSCTHKKISDQEERKKTCIYNAYNWLRPLHIWIYENKTMQYFTADGVHNDVARGMQNEGIYIVNIYFKQKWSVYY